MIDLLPTQLTVVVVLYSQSTWPISSSQQQVLPHDRRVDPLELYAIVIMHLSSNELRKVGLSEVTWRVIVQPNHSLQHKKQYQVGFRSCVAVHSRDRGLNVGYAKRVDESRPPQR